MNKRIIIFSPEARDQEEISLVVREYFLKNFPSYLTKIEVQKYSTFSQPKPTKNQLGHWESGEILAIIDRRISGEKNRYKGLEKTPYYKSLGISCEMSINLCREKNIPFVIYKGEVRRKVEKEFTTRIDEFKEQIKNRLEAKVQ